MLLTYLFMLVIMSVGARALKFKLKEFAIGFTVIFWVSYGCWLIGNLAYIAATPDKRAAFKIPWSLGLTGEAGFVVALLAGLVVGNFFPRATAFLTEATRPEWYIKTAIVILGAFLGVQAAGATGLAKAIMFRGFARHRRGVPDLLGARLSVARKVFKFSKEWSAPLASGISICGVSAAIATGAAIKSRPVVPIMVSSLVVVFAVVELLFLPFVAETFLYQRADGRRRLDGPRGQDRRRRGGERSHHRLADPGEGARGHGRPLQGGLDAHDHDDGEDLHRHLHRHLGVHPGGHLGHRDREEAGGEGRTVSSIWERCPKFVFGYIVTFVVMLLLAIQAPALLAAAKVSTAESNVFRVLFFVMTFFTIGLVSNFRKLWEEGIGKLALVYVVCLFGFIVWIGLAISWVFFHGIVPPTV